MVEFQLPKLATRVRFPSLAFVIVLFLSLSLSSCSTIQYTPTPIKLTIPKPQPGVYHKVQKGETIWRIAKTYDLSIDEIVSQNNIPNAAVIEQGQLVFIPGAKEIQTIEVPVSPTVPSASPTVLDLAAIKQENFIWPIKGRLLSYFSETQGLSKNRGIDIRAQSGESVRASRSGEVVFADYLTGYGYVVILDHFDGLFSSYSQNEALAVKLGDKVSQGDVIGSIGKYEKLSFLHFEIRRGETPDNPLYYLP